MKDNKIFAYRVYWLLQSQNKNKNAVPGEFLNRFIPKDKEIIVEHFVSDVTSWGRDFKNDHEVKEIIRKNYADLCGTILADKDIHINHIERRI